MLVGYTTIDSVCNDFYPCKLTCDNIASQNIEFDDVISVINQRLGNR